jgi:hypothetical protein
MNGTIVKRKFASDRGKPSQSETAIGIVREDLGAFHFTACLELEVRAKSLFEEDGPGFTNFSHTPFFFQEP